MSVKFASNVDSNDFNRSTQFGSRFKNSDKTSITSILVHREKRQNESQQQLSRRKLNATSNWSQLNKSNDSQDREVRDAAISNTVISFYKGRIAPQSRQANSSMDRLRVKLLTQGFRTSYKQAIATTKDFSLTNIISKVKDRKNKSYFISPAQRASLATMPKKSSMRLSTENEHQGDNFGCIEQEDNASMRLVKRRLNAQLRPQFRVRSVKKTVDMQNMELRESLQDIQDKNFKHHSTLNHLDQTLRKINTMQHEFISKFKKKQYEKNPKQQDSQRSMQAEGPQINIENLDPEPKIFSALKDQLSKQIDLGQNVTLSSMETESEEEVDLSSTHSQKSFQEYRKRTKREQLCFQLDPNDTRELKDMKYVYRIQDLQKQARNQTAIITPDPRLRSPDRMVAVDIFDGDFRETKKENKKNLKVIGDPRKKQIEFMKDMNTIAWQTAIVQQRCDKVRKSNSLMLNRNKITQELVENQLTAQVGEKLKMAFIEKFASFEAGMMRKNSLLLQQPEGVESSIKGMGLFSLIKKNLMEMQNQEAVQSQTSSPEQSERKFTSSIVKQKTRILVEPNYYKMYKDKMDQVKNSTTIKKGAAQRWVNQTKMLEHQIRIHRDKLHEINKIVNLVKRDQQKIPLYKFEKINRKYAEKSLAFDTIKIEQNPFEESRTRDMKQIPLINDVSGSSSGSYTPKQKRWKTSIQKEKQKK